MILFSFFPSFFFSYVGFKWSQNIFATVFKINPCSTFKSFLSILGPICYDILNEMLSRSVKQLWLLHLLALVFLTAIIFICFFIWHHSRIFISFIVKGWISNNFSTVPSSFCSCFYFPSENCIFPNNSKISRAYIRAAVVLPAMLNLCGDRNACARCALQLYAPTPNQPPAPAPAPASIPIPG